METNFNFNYVIQRWDDYHSWFLFTKNGVASCRLSIYDDNPKEGVVSDLFVRETSRNKGYATALLEFSAKIAKGDGCETISLRSDQNDWVREWYRRSGFEEVSSQVWLSKKI